MGARFQRYVGIDYSGARSPDSRLRGLQVYEAVPEQSPRKVHPPAGPRRNWTRREVAAYCHSVIGGSAPAVIGIDHGFSFPESYFRRYGLDTWDAFVADFVRHWPTDREGAWVDDLRDGNPRAGASDELRLCERWTAGAKSVFQFDVQGSVAKSTHAGLPWLAWLRARGPGARRLHVWPFDGFEPSPGSSVVAEVFPSLLRRRYAADGRTPDEQDAWAVANWLRTMDARGSLSAYFHPPLDDAGVRAARREGWILGVW